MNFFERKFVPLMYRALQRPIKAFAADLRSRGSRYAFQRLDQHIIDAGLSNEVLRIYKTVGIFFANDTYRNIQEQVPTKGFGFNQEWINEIINYFRLHLLNKAVLPILETTKRQIMLMLEQGEREGWGVDEIARKLTSSELTMFRARLIVRTESSKAMFKGREVAKDNSPYRLTSEWIAAHDHRTRHSHRLVDGVVIPMGGKFSVPIYKKLGKADIQIGVDMMEGPGDPNAHVSNVANCRCTTAERVVFDENKNPVMKNQNVLA